MNIPTQYDGGCICGNIRFRAIGEPKNPHTCSCHTCQAQSGALTLAWVEFPKGSVHWTGDGGEPSKYRSSEFSSRCFCPKCGSSLGAIDDEPTIALLLGVFDTLNTSAFIPIKHSYASSRPHWWHIQIDISSMEA